MVFFFFFLYFKCHEINPSQGGSYIDSLDWIENKKTTINPISRKDNKCFQYPVTVVLKFKKIGGHPERITKITLFIKKYNRKQIN